MIQTVGVVGAGQMGRGIAQVAAVAGHAVVLHDQEPGQWETGRAAIEQSLDKFVEKRKLTPEERDAALARITFSTRLDALAPAELVIEAIVEDLGAKQALWRRLEAVTGKVCLFASNTSSLSIVDQSVGLAHPDRLMGLHFFNPVPLMALVEVVRSVRTSPAVLATGEAFVRGLGKVPVPARDESGFVVNRLLVPYLLDAVRALEHGLGRVEDLDAAMHLGAGHPMGPFTLLDFVGLDTVVRIADIMFDQFREPRYAPPPLLRRMVAAGYHGRKNGRGFYDWSTEPPAPMELGL
ncbi:MAG: 3-hydroxyacyl-CoA dehydrogenase family protein [Gemmatimonadetes bacterium]|nr:3-hydroxyacyl-CoA dehydrogenase family protein [Gemmatimonadota bacterium]MCB9504620.1 3-hydroxyacyl-CoA dehydrogenase family protein [Gemmatimonadales bacterium]MCA9761619.1 3-hydroxyacyl-CoA dehydrogenase family protein [Gemmatimonadota bacterium]MCA9767545.1 3-hydroxyacyl-CoA dehydrogenase family protein [Gemmatimonadota bacterium]HPF60660.1 3-hydroxyacyl-CoA dehydrogenase family protein [Gemmatimonadales bacterium]